MDKRQQSTTNYPIGIFMASSTDHVTGVTGTSVALYISKNGGVWEHCSGSVTEMGYGWYSWAGNTYDRNTLGELSIHASGTSCDPFDGKLDVVSWNPFPDYIGTPIALDGGTPTIAGMLTKFADDNGGASYDATSDSLRGLATSIAASAPVSATAVTGTATVGTVISGNFSNTWTQNSVYWQIRATGAAAIDAQLTYAVGTGKLANTVRVIGRYQVSGSTVNKYVNVQAYNYKTLAWDTISATSTRINGQTASTDNTYTYALTVDHLSVAGAAIIRFVGSDTTASSDLYLDYVPYLYQTQGTTTDAIAQAVYLKMRNTVYDGGVYIDTINGVAGTVIGDNGTAWNPVNTLADALTISNTLGTKRLYFKPDSEITLNQSFANWRFIGRGIVHLANQNISDAWFQDLEFVDGLSSGTDAIFQSCIVGSGSFYPVWFDRCALNGSVTMLSAGEYTFERCYDGSPSTTINPTFIFTSGALVGIRGWNGGLALNNMVAGNYATIEGMGRIVIDSNCSGGNITVRGFFPAVTDQVGGGFAGTLTDTQRYGEDQNVYAVTNGWVSTTGTVILNATQPSITWGQQKIVANVSGEGALDILNSNMNGFGQYNHGAIGQLNEGTSIGEKNFGTDAGQSNYGNDAGQYNLGTTGPGQYNTGNNYGQSNIGTLNGQINSGASGSGISSNGISSNLIGTVQAVVDGWVQHSGTVVASSVTGNVAGSVGSVLTPVTVIGYVQTTGTVNAIVLGYVQVTGTVNANIVSSNNIDFTALQQTRLSSITPSSVGSVTNPVTIGTNNDKTGYSIIGYVNVTGTSNANIVQWLGTPVVAGAIPVFAAGTAGGIPTVDLNNYIAGIQGTKNQLDDLNDIAAGTQMDLVNAPNGTAITAFTNDIFTETIEGTTNFKRWIRRMGAVLFGKANGGGAAGSKKFRDTTDTVNRVDATTDANGNRTSVTFDDTDT